MPLDYGPNTETGEGEPEKFYKEEFGETEELLSVTTPSRKHKPFLLTSHDHGQRKSLENSFS